MTTAGDERTLMTRLRARDAGAFRMLVDRHMPVLLGVARRILQDEAESEDVVQEAFVKLWQNGAALEIGDAGVRPWLRRVVTNQCIDRIRSGRRTDVTDEVPEQPVAATQFTSLAESDLSARVSLALQRLPERQRQALALFHFEGLSQSEVAKALAVSDEAVESLLSRARRTLRGVLKDEWRQLLPGDGEAS
jgi:RNA polymerase sigma-70 factor (ECF subfamily)